MFSKKKKKEKKEKKSLIKKITDYIFIDEEQRGKGYGKMLFSKIIEKSKELGWNEPKITFEKENIPMIKIAVDCGGILYSSDGAMVKYVIKVK